MHVQKSMIIAFWIVAPIVALLCYFDSAHLWWYIGGGVALVFGFNVFKAWQAEADAEALAKPATTVEDMTRKRQAYRRSKRA